MKTAYLLVNFGGPRSLNEVEPFLKALLTDQDVVRSQMPKLMHQFLFQRVAKRRAQVVAKDYALIGGGSPIYEDTEAVAEKLKKRVLGPVVTFHRYLLETHEDSIQQLLELDCEEIKVFPLFPQFTYATTGSIARLLYQTLPKEVLVKLKWVKSYPTHPAYIELLQNKVRKFLESKNLSEEEIILLFSAHGIPKKFVEGGDLYEGEVRGTFEKVMQGFPRTLGRLCYQSKFGPGEWLRPYTIDLCERIAEWSQGREKVLFVPISFTSDHIETLFEVEHQYMPVIREQGFEPYRLPGFNRCNEWIEVIAKILEDTTPVSTNMLVRWG